MPNFLPVFHLDTLELAGSLRTRWGLFQTDMPGHRVLRIRGHAKGTDEADDKFGIFAPAKGWVELRNLRSEVVRRAEAILPPGVEEGRVFFEMLDHAATLNWACEEYNDSYFDRWTRAILPLRTNPATLMVYGTETASPAQGVLTIVSPKLPHCAINMGDHPWVWLTVDFRKKVPAE